MSKLAPITIYNASAGSGKTFTLVQRYLEKLLGAQHPDAYKNFLAITFTNKAVAEMKNRIIETLVDFSADASIEDTPDMLRHIAEATGLPITTLQKNAKQALTHLLHHYALFSVETIDHFNHRLIRTFARDLKLPAHFEVSLDVQQLIAEAVDNLISNAGEDPEVTKILVQFALDKTDDDKSWDIAYDITSTATLLLNENDATFLNKLKHMGLSDFQQLKSKLYQKREADIAMLRELALATLQTIEEAGLEKTDFNGGSRAYFPNYLEKLSDNNLNVSYGAAWQENMGEKPMYPKTKTTDFVAQTIDALTPNFIDVFNKSKLLVGNIWKYNNILKNLTPLSVLHLVQQELDALKKERNVLPISEFNSLINKEIRNQPAPFIYERLGDRYQHFFIDEFQDTSLLQWQNLIPLVDNAVSQELNGLSGSVLLVGDAKQAIYRWRGGLPEQFMDLYGETNPFSNKNKKIENLVTNWRSCKQIIDFNNSFFSFLSSFFANPIHQYLYEIGNKQAENSKPEGYVQIAFIASQDKEEADQLYGAEVLATIKKLCADGYELSDICILTRTKKNGVILSEYLLSENIPIVSSETLLLQQSSLVQCLVNGLTTVLHPENGTAKALFLEFLHRHFDVAVAKHHFLKTCLDANSDTFSDTLESFGIAFKVGVIVEKSLFEACEYMVQQLELHREADAYLFAFMDLVLDFSNQPQAGKLAFLEHWETKKQSASIPANNTQNAIQIMTIHKSKGLEFPVVIYPYANTKLYAELQAKAWYPVDELGFDEVLINFNNELQQYGPMGEEMYQERRNTLELDTINLLYVTMTRAVEQLYVFSDLPKKINTEAPADFNNLFISYLEKEGVWSPDQLVYSFGTFQATADLGLNKAKKILSHQLVPTYQVSSPEAHQLHVARTAASLWQTDAEVAIDIGNLLHDTMEQIVTKSDVPQVLRSYRERAVHSAKEIDQLEHVIWQIVGHPELAKLYDDAFPRTQILNERDVITSAQQIVRPDRLNFFENKTVSIVDYKTGVPNKKHDEQLKYYAETLKDLGYSINESILIYSDGTSISINKI